MGGLTQMKTFAQFLDSIKESKIVKDYESVRQEDDVYQTVQQKLANPRLRKLRRYLNREVGRYTV